MVANAGDVLLYNTALWHGLSEHIGTEPRYALLSGWSRPWLWRGWTKPPPLPKVLERAGINGEAIFGVCFLSVTSVTRVAHCYYLVAYLQYSCVLDWAGTDGIAVWLGFV